MRDNPPDDFVRSLKEKITDEILFKDISNYILNMDRGMDMLHEIVDELQNENDRLQSELYQLSLNSYNRSGINRIK